jgi:FlaA1/EpsC-like NDP-sugar epimerase
MVLFFLAFRLEEYPRSIFVIDWFVVLVLVGGSRFAYRLYREGWPNPGNGQDSAKKVLIVGAGRAGEMLLREILGNYRIDYQPIGFLDDNRKKRNLTIHGYRVMGNTRDIPHIVKKYNVETVFLAIPSSSGAAKRRIMKTCKRAGVKSKTLPPMGEILKGAVKVSSLRISDRRPRQRAGQTQYHLDQEYLRNKTVLITGAGGSIGSSCRQVAHFSEAPCPFR